MTPLQFEGRYAAEWDELEKLLAALKRGAQESPAERMASLYRRACEQLALARSRTYPAHIIDRLNHLTAEAHQAIYQRREVGAQALRRLLVVEFPSAVRAHGRYVLLATLTFVAPLLSLGVLAYLNPELILSLLDAEAVAQFEDMYSGSGGPIGRARKAESDWIMFGFYIYNNIGIAFQCFAGGLFAGVGSLFFLGFNGAYIGAVAGYLTQRGFSAAFYSFVATHGAFELTAIVLSGAAGLRIGRALLAPGRRTRRHALTLAARESIVIVYGATGLLVIAAAIEAFWSSAPWIPHAVKYAAAACCWLAVFGYLWRQSPDAR